MKPVRLQQCRALQNKIKRSGSTLEKTSQLQGIERYERIRPVGSGAAGIVSLYRNRIDNKEYALKEIDLSSLSPKDKKSARDEVQFLRVLRGPTIVKFYESFNHESSIFIVMEYASKGNLEQAIVKKIMSGTKFSTKYIFRCLAHQVMAVMAMHNKNILHRDIKTQNIFIDDKGVHKLGDFGISRELKQDAKAMTACGTPFFMPPEVCLGKPYDSKADVWAIGVIIYELIMLKKPFRGEQIYNVLQAITKCSYDPLDEDCDPNLQMIVFSLLQKDFNKRPSIFEVANFPCVRKEIMEFIEESGCHNEVLEIIDFINPAQ